MESTMRSGKRRLFAILAAVLVTAVLAVLVLRWLKTRGTKRFAQL